jgi:hypothetical protein
MGLFIGGLLVPNRPIHIIGIAHNDTNKFLRNVFRILVRKYTERPACVGAVGSDSINRFGFQQLLVP